MSKLCMLFFFYAILHIIHISLCFYKFNDNDYFIYVFFKHCSDSFLLTFYITSVTTSYWLFCISVILMLGIMNMFLGFRTSLLLQFTILNSDNKMIFLSTLQLQVQLFRCSITGVNTTHLSYYVLDEFVYGKANVRMYGEHFTQGVLVLRGLQITIQQTAHHVQKCRVVLLQLHLTWTYKDKTLGQKSSVPFIWLTWSFWHSVKYITVSVGDTTYKCLFLYLFYIYLTKYAPQICSQNTVISF